MHPSFALEKLEEVLWLEMRANQVSLGILNYLVLLVGFEGSRALDGSDLQHTHELFDLVLAGTVHSLGSHGVLVCADIDGHAEAKHALPANYRILPLHIREIWLEVLYWNGHLRIFKSAVATTVVEKEGLGINVGCQQVLVDDTPSEKPTVLLGAGVLGSLLESPSRVSIVDVIKCLVGEVNALLLENFKALIYHVGHVGRWSYLQLQERVVLPRFLVMNFPCFIKHILQVKFNVALYTISGLDDIQFALHCFGVLVAYVDYYEHTAHNEGCILHANCEG